jgi:octaprenyl-diphosphate synthase
LMRTGINGTVRSFVSRVRLLIREQLEDMETFSEHMVQLLPGKMLRTRLGARLAAEVLPRSDGFALDRVCAATELVHTAALCHDDVIDNGTVRRAKETLWKATSVSGAILIGDLLLCKAMELLVDTLGGRYVGSFVSKVTEVCDAEAEQELKYRGTHPDEGTCLRLARGKTGPLFAFIASVCGGDEERLCSALEEAGYRIGTAYQLADDLLDMVGEEGISGKTLSTDAAREKFTLAQVGGAGKTAEYIDKERRGALICLDPWPQARSGVERFFECDLQPVFDRYFGRVPDTCKLRCDE